MSTNRRGTPQSICPRSLLSLGFQFAALHAPIVAGLDRYLRGENVPSIPQHWIGNMEEPLANLLFEYPGADLILRSHDSHHFRVLRSYIINSSPVLEALLQKAPDPCDEPQDELSLSLLQLPESGAILHSLLTFIFPVTPFLPSTTEKTMELLSVAQKYQMVSALSHIQGSIARQNPPSTEQDSALRVYTLAQRYGLRQEALQAAQTILKYPMNIEDLGDKLYVVPGTSLYELWRYYEEARAILASNLTEFKTSGAHDPGTLYCVASGPSAVPRWLDDYITSIGDAPHHFDLIEFHAALARHIKDEGGNHRCACVSISPRTIRNFWEALASVVRNSFNEVRMIQLYALLIRLTSSQAESALCLVQERQDSQTQVDPPAPLPELLDVPDANLIIQSSDLVNFRVHKSALAMTSPFFKDLLSLPQPSDSETIDGLPVVRLSEDAELLNSLLSVVYPVRLVIPKSYDKVLYLLAACEKYDMDRVQSVIRAEVDRGIFPSPAGREVFGAYSIASDKGLAPEMEAAARLTLDYPLTYEALGEELRLFEGPALCHLARFRKRCTDNLIACLKSFVKADAPGPSKIWVGCPSVTSPGYHSTSAVFPTWLTQGLSWDDLKLQVFTHPLPTPSSIRGRYMTAIQSHDKCNFCLRMHAKEGSAFCAELESKLASARDKVHISV
jgi:BTB/POZ domain